MKLLETHALSIGYGAGGPRARILARGLNLTLHAGSLVCLLGPNGAGKSTLIRTLAGLHPPLAGEVRLMGERVHDLPPLEIARRLSVVLTERVEVGMLSVRSMVALGRHAYTGWAGQLSERDEHVVTGAIQAVGAMALVSRMMDELSDGERQKVMIARALAQEPALILLDEPTAFLDLPRRVEIMQVLRRLTHTTGKAVLLSTHDLDLALRMADEIWLMAADGTLVAGVPEDLVLNGTFADVFQGDGVAFDSAAGTFRIAAEGTIPVFVSGPDPARMWTRRALIRAGFAVCETPQESAAQVDICQGWLVSIGSHITVCDSIQHLLAHLRGALMAR